MRPIYHLNKNSLMLFMELSILSQKTCVHSVHINHYIRAEISRVTGMPKDSIRKAITELIHMSFIERITTHVYAITPWHDASVVKKC
jgi:hypothetical protein